jgi:uncharacterized protein UPF0150
MIQEYIRAAMLRAKYEIVEDDESFYGHIEEFPAHGQMKKHWKRAAKSLRV